MNWPPFFRANQKLHEQHIREIKDLQDAFLDYCGDNGKTLRELNDHIIRLELELNKKPMKSLKKAMRRRK